MKDVKLSDVREFLNEIEEEGNRAYSYAYSSGYFKELLSSFICYSKPADRDYIIASMKNTLDMLKGLPDKPKGIL